MPLIRFQVENYRAVSKQLKAVNPALQKTLAKEIKVFTDELVATSRAKASWSKTIPAAIVPMSGLTAGIRVKRAEAIAPLNERPGGWRHPVFGNKTVWRHQDSKPSVRPTVEAGRSRFIVAAERAVRDATKEAGL